MASATIQNGAKFGSVAAYASILETGRFADFQVECQSHIWKLHRCILFEKSVFFSRALDGNFKELDDGKMKFPVDDPAIVARLLIFLYTGDFPRANPKNRESVLYKGQFATLVDPFEDCDRIDELNLCIKTYCLAEKYLDPDLKRLALRYYCDTLHDYVEHLKSIQKHVSEDIFGSKLISWVYDADTLEKDRNLKDPLLVKILLDLQKTKHINQLDHAKMVVDAPSEFIFDLLMRSFRRWRLECKTCGDIGGVLACCRVCGGVDCDERQC